MGHNDAQAECNETAYTLSRCLYQQHKAWSDLGCGTLTHWPKLGIDASHQRRCQAAWQDHHNRDRQKNVCRRLRIVRESRRWLTEPCGQPGHLEHLRRTQSLSEVNAVLQGFRVTVIIATRPRPCPCSRPPLIVRGYHDCAHVRPSARRAAVFGSLHGSHILQRSMVMFPMSRTRLLE